MTLAPRSALVTGAASGIGAAVSTLLAERGYDVVLVDRDERVDQTAERIGGSAIVLDLADRTAFGALSEIPHLDVVVTCAAIAPESVFDDVHLADAFRRTLDVNVESVVAVVQACLPQLRKSLSPRILTVSSIQGFAAGEGALAYATSKGAVNSLTRALAVDLAGDGILVNALAPGFVDTAMALLPDGSSEYDTDWFQEVYLKHGRIPLRRPAQPEEIAEAAEFFVSARNTYVTGTVLPIDGGLLATF